MKTAVQLRLPSITKHPQAKSPLLYYIEPALNHVLASSDNLLEKVIKTHTRHMANIISCAEPILSHECRVGNLIILPAYYSLSTGKVDFEDNLG